MSPTTAVEALLVGGLNEVITQLLHRVKPGIVAREDHMIIRSADCTVITHLHRSR